MGFSTNVMAIYTVLDRKAVSSLVRDYGLGRLSVVQGVPAGSVNTHYYIEAAKGKYVLRIDEMKAHAEAQREIDLLIFLRKHGVPCPRPVTDKNGQHLRDYEGKPVSLYHNLPGKGFSAATLTEDHVEKIGTMLAKLHVAGQKFSASIDNRFGFERIQSLYQHLRPRIDTHLKHLLHVLDDEIAHHEEYLEERLPSGMIHGDLFPDNVLFRGSRIVGVLDFEAACRGKFIYDLATAVNALCYHAERYHIGRFNALLRGYQSTRTLSLARMGCVSQRTPLLDLPVHVDAHAGFLLSARGGEPPRAQGLSRVPGAPQNPAPRAERRHGPDVADHGDRLRLSEVSKGPRRGAQPGKERDRVILAGVRS